MGFSDAQVIAGNSAGAMDGDGSKKLLLHSTEGSTIESALGAYRTNNSWPTLTVDCPRRRCVRHLPLDVAARALRNEAGGVQTNKEGSILVQIEMVGFAGTPSSIGSPADLDWFGREVVAPIIRATGIPLTVGVRFASYPGSYGKNAAQRLSPAAWDSYSGICGHQHAPENTHGDPGAIDVARIVAAARTALDPTPVPVLEDDMFIFTFPGRTSYLVCGGVGAKLLDGENYNSARQTAPAIHCKSAEQYDEFVGRFAG